MVSEQQEKNASSRSARVRMWMIYEYSSRGINTGKKWRKSCERKSKVRCVRNVFQCKKNK